MVIHLRQYGSLCFRSKRDQHNQMLDLDIEVEVKWDVIVPDW